MKKEAPSRRTFIKGLGLITVGFSLGSTPLLRRASAQSLPRSLSAAPRIDSWLQVLQDGRIRVLTGKMELGQGIRTAIAQVAAEELNTSPNRVEVHLAETDVTPNEGYTAGSASIEQSAMSVRYAAASAGKILLRRASEKLGLPASELRLEEAAVQSLDGERRLGFFEILDGAQIQETARADAPLKEKAQHRWVGKPVPRADIELMARGQQIYVQDLRFPGMVHARVIRPARYGAKLLECDESALLDTVTGVLELVRDGSFLAVVAEEEHQAERAQFFLNENTRWSEPAALPEGDGLKDYLKGLSTRFERVRQASGLSFGADSHKASYFRPYVMHGSIGPSCAVAHFDGDRLQVWTHSQGVYPLRESLTELLGMPAEKIRVTGVPGSGCYGHNGADDAAADAALIAVALPKKHVRLQWSRDNEHAWEPYGSAMIMELEASLDGSGRVEQWSYQLWSDTHSVRPSGGAGQLLAGQYLEKAYAPPESGYFGGAYRNSTPVYVIPKLAITAHQFDGPLRASALRSLGAYANVFAIESFMDELAERAGKDPVEFRLEHLEDPRAKDVLRQARKMVATAEHPGEGIGYAFSRYKNSAAYCAVAAKVIIDDEGRPRVAKMWAAIDAGEVINPDGLKNQTEGGLTQSASWTMQEQVRFGREGVTSRDWDSYPIARFTDAPDVEVAVIDRPDQPPLGAGEAAQGPASAAIANAYYRASGRRSRDLPLSK